MNIEVFKLERFQSLYENTVEYNLGDSGAHPLSLKECLRKEQIEELLETPCGYGHTLGSLELRKAIAKRYQNATESNILVTNGTAEANFFSTMTLVNPGDEIIYVVPNYLQILGLANMIGAKVHQIKLDEHWQIPVDQVEKACTKNTKIISFCNPNNPTGQVCKPEILEKIIQIARSVNAYVLVDEVYREAPIEGDPLPSLYGNYEKCIVNSSLSKSFGLPGLRLGWTIGPKEYIEQVTHYHDYTTIAPNKLSDFIATKVLSDESLCMNILREHQRKLKINLEIFTEWSKQFKDILSWKPPYGGAMIYVKYKLPISSRELMLRILQEQNVLVVAGDDYSMEAYLRIGLGIPSEDLGPALKRVGVVLNSLIV